MELLFIADGRSPTALNWIGYFVDQGHRVHLVSMYACRPDLHLESLTVIPAAFSGATSIGKKDADSEGGNLTRRFLRTLMTPRLRTWLRHNFVPGSLPPSADKLAELIIQIQPDLVHAMRIPYEGMLAALSYAGVPKPSPPLLISVWGNDFSLHASATRKMAALTRQAMQVTDGLHTDCSKDQRLAKTWGFDPIKPSVVLPGAGGIQLDTFFPGDGATGATVINPRGLRVYVRNDTFFKAIPQVLAIFPEARFLCPAMAGQREAESWVRKLGLGKAVTLLPYQNREDMGALYRQAKVVVSPSTHDGTPNTLLEAMACGCTPVVGDIESLREWITPGVNGLLVNPADPQELAEAIVAVISNDDFAAKARDLNLKLIQERAAYKAVMKKAADFYNQLGSRRHNP